MVPNNDWHLLGIRTLGPCSGAGWGGAGREVFTTPGQSGQDQDRLSEGVLALKEKARGTPRFGGAEITHSDGGLVLLVLSRCWKAASWASRASAWALTISFPCR